MRYVLLLLSALLLLSCSPKEPLYNTQTYVFGTLVDISIYGETDAHAQSAANAIINHYNKLHQRLHAWQPSEISKINDAFSVGKSSSIKADVAQMIQQMTTLSTQSHGAFNPAIGHLINTWGFQSDAFLAKHVNAAKIQQLVAKNPQMIDIVIENNNIRSNNPAVKLDLGGYAKGYALDLGLQTLREHHVQHALINIGGNIVALGQHGDRPWRVGIQHPRQPNAIASIALPSGWAIGTSGDYQRFFDLDGKRYCHLINPSTGYPAQHTQSVTVMIPPQQNAGVLSDVASKPIFLAPKNKRLAAAKSMNIERFLIIGSEGKLQISQQMQAYIDWTNPKQSVEVVAID